MERETFRYSIDHKVDDNVFEEEISNCFSILITRANNLK